jgi:uncharacterized protein YndB with AHSA1/START domain
VVRFRLDRRFDFALTRDEVWSRLTRTEDFPRWWPWLRRIEGDGFVEGGTTRIAVAAPVPWVLRLELRVTDLVEGESVDVDVSGDLSGTASLSVAATAGGSTARMAWSVSPSSPALRLATRMTYPLVVFGQNWVVNAGLRQFRTAVEP